MKINLVKWIGGGVGVIVAGIMSITPMTVFAQEPQEVKETAIITEARIKADILLILVFKYIPP